MVLVLLLIGLLLNLLVLGLGLRLRLGLRLGLGLPLRLSLLLWLIQLYFLLSRVAPHIGRRFSLRIFGIDARLKVREGVVLVRVVRRGLKGMRQLNVSLRPLLLQLLLSYLSGLSELHFGSRHKIVLLVVIVSVLAIVV